MNLRQLEKLYDKHFYIEDFLRFEVGWATYLSSQTRGEPIWMILVGASGGTKSAQLKPMLDAPRVVRLHNLTSKTLVNGWKNKKQHPDLAPELRDKVIIIPDMAQILKLPPVEKAEVWAQLRDLYDGFAGRSSGSGSRAKYSDIHVTLLTASTNAIDSQILIHQDLGTRELIYRTQTYKAKKKLIKSARKIRDEDKILSELRRATEVFLETRKVKEFELPKKIESGIEDIALFVANLRAIGEFDQYTNELRNEVYPEEPTRITKQLTRLYYCLKALDDNYPDDRALAILWHIGRSCCFPLRLKIWSFLAKEKREMSTSQIAEELKLGKKTVLRECQVLNALSIVDVRWKETNFPDKHYFYWKISEKQTSIPSLNIVYSIRDFITIYTLYGDGFSEEASKPPKLNDEDFEK